MLTSKDSMFSYKIHAIALTLQLYFLGKMHVSFCFTCYTLTNCEFNRLVVQHVSCKDLTTASGISYNKYSHNFWTKRSIECARESRIVKSNSRIRKHKFGKSRIVIVQIQTAAMNNNFLPMLDNGLKTKDQTYLILPCYDC